jgi:hypothetical protein
MAPLLAADRGCVSLPIPVRLQECRRECSGRSATTLQSPESWSKSGRPLGRSSLGTWEGGPRVTRGLSALGAAARAALAIASPSARPPDPSARRGHPSPSLSLSSPQIPLSAMSTASTPASSYFQPPTPVFSQSAADDYVFGAESDDEAEPLDLEPPPSSGTTVGGQLQQQRSYVLSTRPPISV